MLKPPQRLRSRSTDITKHDTNISQGLPMTGDPLPKPPPTVMPTAVTDPKVSNPGQATASFPSAMKPRSPASASQPTVPANAAMPAARATAPAAPAPQQSRIMSGGKSYGDRLPSTVSHSEIRAAGRKIGGW